MKRIICMMAAATCLFASMAASQAATLTVITEGLRNTDGRVAIALFDSGQGFPKEDARAVKRVFVPLQDVHGTVQAVIRDLPPGAYAVAVFHDSDNSGKLETSFFGIPRKGYGFSNNVTPSMRPASFEEARFALPETGATVAIRLNYRGD